jgi:hypothetical protein
MPQKSSRLPKDATDGEIFHVTWQLRTYVLALLLNCCNTSFERAYHAEHAKHKATPTK